MGLANHAETACPDRNEALRDTRLGHIAREAALSNVFIVLTGGAFLTGLVLSLGANDFQIGLLGALPFMAQCAQLLSPYIESRAGDRKPFAFHGLLVGRQIWWLVILALLLPIGWKLEVVFAVLAVSAIITMIVTPGWVSWLADVVPEKSRGRWLGTRNVALSASTVAATIGGSIILDRFRGSGEDIFGFVLLIAIGCLGALVALRSLSRLPACALPAETASPWQGILEPVRRPAFRRLLGVFALWNVAIGLSGAFFAPHMLLNLHMTFVQIGLYTSGHGIVAVLLARPWGDLIDRYGSKSVLVVCAFGIAFVPVVWLFVRDDRLWLLIPEVILSGAVWAGFNLAAFTLPIDRSPKKLRSAYLAVFAVVTGLAFFGASLLAGGLAESWRHFHWHVGGQTLINYHLLFSLSALLRFLTALLMLAFREPSDVHLPVMIQLMGYAVLKRLSLGRQVFPFAVEVGEDHPATKNEFPRE
jgi:MFS family permease